MAPVLRGLASAIFPGWGQALNGEPRKAATFRVAALITLVIADLVIFSRRVASIVSTIVTLQAYQISELLTPPLVAGLCLWALAVYDAVVVYLARRDRRT